MATLKMGWLFHDGGAVKKRKPPQGAASGQMAESGYTLKCIPLLKTQSVIHIHSGHMNMKRITLNVSDEVPVAT